MITEYHIMQVPIRGHRMVTFPSSDASGTSDVYIIGGLSTARYLDGRDEILKLVEKRGRMRFYLIPARLEYGRAYHVALPIPPDFARKSCPFYEVSQNENSRSDEDSN